MVPHIKIEELLHELAGLTEQSFAVTGLPDPRKGECLAVLHTLDETPLAHLLAKLAADELPNLWKPKPDKFFAVSELPYLGSGKLDLKGVRATARKLEATS